MKKGAGKTKGNQFERLVCKELSLWITHGKKADCFWRSAISGGRATAAHKRGEHVRQAGDICAVAPEGHEFCDTWYVECKHYRNLRIASFLLDHRGPLHKFWQECVKQATRHRRRPMLIAKQNNHPAMVITAPGGLILRPLLAVHRCDIYYLHQLTKTNYQP